jgi:diguanylate cyclase (GGDEF)-like protein
MMRKVQLNKKRVLFIFILIALALLLCLLFAFLSSDDDNDNAETIVFLGNEKIAPIIYAEKGIAKGVAVDIAKEIGEKIGYRVVVNAIDWENAQKKVLSGEADALLQINPNSEREKLYDFSDELLKSEFSIFIKSGSSIKTVNDLKNMTVGVEGGGYPYHLLQKYEEINISIIPDWDTGFHMVKSGELDAIVVDRWIGEYELAQNKVKEIQVIEEPIEIHNSRIAVKKGNEELLNLINVGLKELNEDGTMANIIRDWQGKKVIYFTQESIRNTLLYITIVFLILILLISLYWVNRFRELSKKLELDVMQRTQELNDTNELLWKANTKLERISMVDGLTNISNRRHFDIFLHKVWSISMREKLPLALIMIDIDNFKLYNDTYGHLAGDKCLKIVADVIKDTIKRPGDFVARFGGEEFVVLLSNTRENGAATVAEEIRVKIEKLGIRNKELGSFITVSLGVAAKIPNEDISSDILINSADRAMYQSKKDGRNRVTKEGDMGTFCLPLMW